MESREGRLSLISWCFYDWANSAFPTLIITFVFSAYFTNEIASDKILGTAQWGYAMSVSAILTAILSPIIGAIADKTGRRKPWLLLFTIVCVMASASLWFSEADPAFVIYTLIAVGLANIGFELCMVFYNSMLPNLTTPSTIGLWSGLGWGLGYVGGLSCLAISMLLFLDSSSVLLGLDLETYEHLRVTGPLVSVWITIFCIPLFVFTEDEPRSHIKAALAISLGLKAVIHTIFHWKTKQNIFCFLLARMIYIDGLNTLFAFGGIFAAGSLGFSFKELVVLGIIMNIAAGAGAVFGALFERRVGSKKLIVHSIYCLIIFSIGILFVDTKEIFWVLICGLGMFIGPVQSASRSLMAQLTPATIRAEMFGLYALSGKATAFVGPAILSGATLLFSSQRAGMATILLFFVLGVFMLNFVKEPKTGHKRIY